MLPAVAMMSTARDNLKRRCAQTIAPRPAHGLRADASGCRAGAKAMLNKPLFLTNSDEGFAAT
jgi:hypothetical protein